MSRAFSRSVLALATTLIASPLLSNSALAGTVDLSAFGWVATTDNNVDITVLSTTNNGLVLSLQKFADFTDAPNADGDIQPLNIVFRQVSRNAVKQIAFEEEHVFNDTGVTWTGFRFAVSGLDGNTGVTFDPSSSSDFSTNPFPNKQFSEGNTVLTVTGGTLESGNFPANLWRPGRESGALYINANPFESGEQNFVFSEQPLHAAQPPFIIPLPASAWTTLAGLGAVTLLHTARRRTA